MRCRLLPAFVLSIALALSSRAAISQEKKDADAILRAYVVDVAEKIGENPRALGSQEAILKKYQELGEKHLALLHSLTQILALQCIVEPCLCIASGAVDGLIQIAALTPTIAAEVDAHQPGALTTPDQLAGH